MTSQNLSVEKLHTVAGTRLAIVEPGTLQLTGHFDQKAATKAVKGILTADASKLAYSMQLGAIIARSWDPAIDAKTPSEEQRAEYAALKSRIQDVMAKVIPGDGQKEKDQRRNIADRALAVALGYLVPEAKVEIAAGAGGNGAVKSPAKVALAQSDVKDKTVTNMGRDIRAAIGLGKAPSAGAVTGTRKAPTKGKAPAPAVSGEGAKSRGGASLDWKSQIDNLAVELAAIVTDPQRLVYLRSKVDRIAASIQKAGKKANAKKAQTAADKAREDAKRDIEAEVAQEIANLEAHLNQ